MELGRRGMPWRHIALLNLVLFSLVVCSYANRPGLHDLNNNNNNYPSSYNILNHDDIKRASNNNDDDSYYGFCESWRFGVESYTLRDWKRVPQQCQNYVQNYMMETQYNMDLDLVSNQSISYADEIAVSDDGKDVWVFDIDETLLSNLPYYSQVQFGTQNFDENSFNLWVNMAQAPALEGSQRLYLHLLKLGFKIYLLTGRDESQRKVTLENLASSGYHSWEELMLRGPEDHGKSAVVYKSERRSKLEKNGFRIRGNSGDQWSDLVGYSIGERAFKLPNPMYYIA